MSPSDENSEQQTATAVEGALTVGENIKWLAVKLAIGLVCVIGVVAVVVYLSM